MFRSFSIKSRMIFLVAFMALFALGIGVVFSMYMRSVEQESLKELEAVMNQGYEKSLKLGIESFASQLSKVYEKTKADGGDAQLAVRLAVRHARYDKTNYYFVYDMKGKTIALPPNPKLYGTNRIDLKDKRGNYLIQDMIKAAKKGGGFTTYWYPRLGAKEASPKKAYVQPIKGTDLFIGTGVYIDDVDVELQRISTKLNSFLSSAQYSVGIGVSVIFIFVVIPLVIVLVRSILIPLKKATQNAHEVAEGNLDVRVDVQGKDEISYLESALRTMINTLVENIQEIEAQSEAANNKARDAEIATAKAEEAQAQAEHAKSEGMQAAASHLETVVERVAAASEEISDKTNEIRKGAAIQSERIAETATAMEEMNATVLEVARNSSEAASVGADSQSKAQDGAAIVRRSIEAMELTQTNILQLKDNMGNLGQQAESIGNIMTVIEDIADQTNLLALNAAIEAARAGDAGRGFAVVADEVRKLAEKTMGATKEVGESIHAIQLGARSNIEKVEKTVTDMNTVVELSNESGSVLTEIVQGVEHSSSQIQGIATAAEEQSATSEEINRSIDEINRITAETTNGVSQTADAVSELMEQMGKLNELIRELKTA